MTYYHKGSYIRQVYILSLRDTIPSNQHTLLHITPITERITACCHKIQREYLSMLVAVLLIYRVWLCHAILVPPVDTADIFITKRRQPTLESITCCITIYYYYSEVYSRPFTSFVISGPLSLPRSRRSAREHDSATNCRLAPA